MAPQKRREPPNMLQNVVTAISALKDNRGSTIQNIVRQINRGANKGRIKKNGTVIQIRKALQQGSRAGVLVHRAGKYKLASSSGNRFKELTEALRKKKLPRKGSKIKKSRSPSISNTSDFPLEETEIDTDDDGDFTERSRSRRRQSSRRGRRRGNSEAAFETGSEYEEILPRKRRRLSRSRSALGNIMYRWIGNLE